MLLSSLSVIPTTDMSIEEQIDCTIRLVVIVSLFLYLINFKHTMHFLLGSLTFIIILFVIQKKSMNKCENYTPPYQRVVSQRAQARSGSVLGDAGPVEINTGLSTTFLARATPSQVNNPTYVYKNQLLAQGANPITKIPPVVVPPSHDLGNWKANNLITHSAVNTMKQRDAYLSGYAVTNDCGTYRQDGGPTYANVEPFAERPLSKQELMQKRVRELVERETPARNAGSQESNNPRARVVSSPSGSAFGNHSVPTVSPSASSGPCFTPEVGSVNVNSLYGYAPSQLERTNVPNNLPLGNCQQSPEMREYNDSLFTQIIQPGVYGKYNVAEPINSNIGISFQQQFEPVSCMVDSNGITFTNNDPNVIVPLEQEMCPGAEVSYDNVYDPRFSGYGSNNRAYVDPTTGQPRFAYDDVDAIRMPNYVVRSKIDFLPYADTFGPIKEGEEFGNPNTRNMKQLVQDSYLENSMLFRNDMMERLMRKRNAELWQLRTYPKAGGRTM
jgi:hypothetical protein